MAIALTEDHLELEGVVRSFVGAQKVRAQARVQLDATEETMPALWTEVAKVGWLGLHLPEEHGGSGFGLPELAVVVAELGRAIVPGPFVPTVIASTIIADRAEQTVRAARLPGLADGTTTAGIGFGGSLIRSGDVVSGDAGIVFGAGLANVLVLRAGADLLLLDRERAGVEVSVPPNLDATRRSGRVRLDNVTVGAADVLAGAAEYGLAVARTVVAAEAVGGAQDCLDSALGYAKVRVQFGRVIGSFQAIKHHLANMMVGAEAALANVWDAARAHADGGDQFRLMAAAAVTLAVPAYVRNAELNIQVHGGIGFTWEHDAHLHLRRAATLRALYGGADGPDDVLALSAAGVCRSNSLELPAEAEQIRVRVRGVVDELRGLDESALRERLIETGYVMPHWPKPWGLAADAVEQLVIEQEFIAAGIEKPDFSITGWVILTLIQHGTPEQIERFVTPALRGAEVWCQLFSEPDAGSDAAAVKTRATRVEGGWLINGQKVWTSGAHRSRRGLATVRSDPSAPKHNGITTVIVDMTAPGVEVRPLRQITGGSEFNEVFFADVFVPDSDVVGEPNAGWTVARATLGNERVSIGGGVAGSEGAAEYLITLAVQHADDVPGSRVRTGRFLATDHALRLLNLRRAVRSITGAGPGPEGNVTKLLLAEHVNERAALSAELLGPEVALGDGPARLVGPMVLGARGMSIAGGTSEVTRNQIAERILGLPREPGMK